MMKKIFLFILLSISYCASGMELDQAVRANRMAQLSFASNIYQSKSSFLELLPKELFSQLMIKANDNALFFFWLMKASSINGKKEMIALPIESINTKEICGSSYDPESNYLALAFYNRTIKILDLNTNACIKIFDKAHEAHITSLLLVKGFLFSGTWQEVKRWDLKKDNCKKINFDFYSHATALAFDDSKDRLAVGIYGKIKIYDLKNKICTHELTPAAPDNAINALVLTQESDKLIVAYGNCRIETWDLNAQQREGIFNLCPAGVYELDFDKNENILYSTGRHQTIDLWDLNKNSWKKSYSESSYSINYQKLARNKNNNFLIAAGKEYIRILDLETLSEVYSHESENPDLIIIDPLNYKIILGVNNQIKVLPLIDENVVRSFSLLTHNQHQLLKEAFQAWKDNGKLIYEDNEEKRALLESLPEGIRPVFDKTISIQFKNTKVSLKKLLKLDALQAKAYSLFSSK